MAYFLGVDAGGTKTEFLLGDETRELGRIQTGSIKRLRRDEEATEQNLSRALTELAAQTGVSMLSVTGCCVGASGSTAPLVAEWITNAFRPKVGGEFLLVEEVDTALDAAFKGGRGLLILAGTGSNVAGRGADGQILTAGGWGPELSDEGSGYFLGIEALRKGFRRWVSVGILHQFAQTPIAPNGFQKHRRPPLVDGDCLRHAGRWGCG